MLTAYGDVELAVKALKSGAVDFILKPWDNEVLLEKIHAALQAVEREKVKQKTDRNRPDRPAEPAMIIGHSAVMMKLIKVVTKVAKTVRTSLSPARTVQVKKCSPAKYTACRSAAAGK